ncbi:unnamed protein product [Penicillium salamii]|uniref:beta-glucosidase n=1 Tax=Penicillium salamii TaxID=1612424 RepID=A0A9W4NU27_9EURO|nr:unnamed protein product [Penicillium salamii]
MSKMFSTNEILEKLTSEEKVSLLSATDWWRTPVIDRDEVFVPHIKATDGPNGARGESYVSGIKAACFPCGTSLGASFDKNLLFRTGQEIAKEAKTKSANVLLAPTLNVIRSPRGCQSEGIAATPKHFVANETENNRKLLTAEVDEQTLREIYLAPFQLVLKNSSPWCFMTSYNRVNGTYVADDARLVRDILRGEWGFKGLVISDWMGVYSTVPCLNAGVDLEMPGPTKFRGEKLLKPIQNNEVSEEAVDDCARRVLELAAKLGRFDQPVEPPERALEDESRDAFIRDGGAMGMVLLKNDGEVLPLPEGATVAVIGYHALTPTLGGGGSARVDSIHAISPADGFQAAGFRTKICPGVPVYGALPHADASSISQSGTEVQTGEPVLLEWFSGTAIGENPVHKEFRPLSEYMIKEKWPEYLDQTYCTRMSFDLRPVSTGAHVFSVISTGPAICYINGTKVFERQQDTNLSPESFYFFKSKLERRFDFNMKAGELYSIVLESWNTDLDILNREPLNGRMFQGSAIRFQEFVDIPGRIQEACTAAQESEYAIVCVGTTNEMESEGFDRDTMDLTSGQYEQIRAVSAANPKTIVVNFSGGPVTMTKFIDRVPAVLQAWFPGQECGHSLASVVSGKVNPSGRLPFTWPRKDEDNPTWLNFPCDKNNIVRYSERLNVGYRYYDHETAPDPLFPFGYGMSYTNFGISDISVIDGVVSGPEDVVRIVCSARNLGSRDGGLVVQYYVEGIGGSPHHDRPRPIKELKEFHKAELAAGGSTDISVTLDKFSFSFYNADQECWEVAPGVYRVHLGLSSQELVGTVVVTVVNGFVWKGI